jgi:hypothetical protein
MYHFKIIYSDSKCVMCGESIKMFAAIAWDNMVTHQLHICVECLLKTCKEMEIQDVQRNSES